MALREESTHATAKAGTVQSIPATPGEKDSCGARMRGVGGCRAVKRERNAVSLYTPGTLFPRRSDERRGDARSRVCRYQGDPMRTLQYLAICCVLALVACGKQEQVDTPLPERIISLDSLPDPCTLLTESIASELLDSDQLETRNLVNERARSRMCSYKQVDGDKMLFLSMMLFAPGTMSSATDSRPELVEKASRLAGGAEPVAILDDLGNISFVFDQANATRLQVLTGIGGALNEDAPPAELQLGYAINLPGASTDARQAALAAIAREHLMALADQL